MEPNESVEKAREVSGSKGCLYGLWVLKADRFPRVTAGKFILAALTARKSLAEKEVRALGACDPTLKPFIVDTK